MNSIIIFGANYLYLVVIFLTAIYIARQPRDLWKEMFVLMAISFPIAYLASKLAGHFYFNPRPFIVGNFIPLIPHAADNGFPSDHVLLSSALSAFMFFYNKKASVALWLITILVGVSRVMAGVHHITDIVGAMAISIIAVGTTEYLLIKFKILGYRTS